MKIRNNNAFTLIELMASMAILSVIVLLVGRLMADGSTAYTSGTTKAEMNDSGRAIFDFIVQDLSNAIADDLIGFRLNSSYLTFYGLQSDNVHFASIAQDPNSSVRNVASILYQVRPMSRREGSTTVTIPNRYQLRRYEIFNQSTLGAYVDKNPDNWSTGTSSVIAENVGAFEVYAYTMNKNGTGINLVSDYFSVNQNDELPVFIDVYLELLSEKDAIEIAAIADNAGVNSGQVAQLAEKRARRFQTRIHFHNREGYNP